MNVDLQKVEEFATKAHSGQTRRDSGVPYIEHPKRVAHNVRLFYPCYVVNGGQLTRDTLCAVALLHDTIEDTETTLEELNRLFGDTISHLVDELTTDNVVLTTVGKTEYLSQKMCEMSMDALFVKYCDRMDNLHDYQSSPDIARALKYAQSTAVILENIARNDIAKYGKIRFEQVHTYVRNIVVTLLDSIKLKMI